MPLLISTSHGHFLDEVNRLPSEFEEVVELGPDGQPFSLGGLGSDDAVWTHLRASLYHNGLGRWRSAAVATTFRHAAVGGQAGRERPCPCSGGSGSEDVLGRSKRRIGIYVRWKTDEVNETVYR